MRITTITSASLPAKKRILTVCVKLFLEQGYKKTTVAEIVHKAAVSNSIFQNIFRAKDGVLTELAEFMFSNQFSMARDVTGAQLPPAYVYAAETAIQMTLTELNENLREIYVESYTHSEVSEFIFRATARELYRIFGPYQPELTEEDFYALELGSAGLMRGYMVRPCDGTLTLEKKLRMFLPLSLRGYKVPEEEVQQILRFVEGLDICTVAEQVMQKLFQALAMHYEFSLSEEAQAAAPAAQDSQTDRRDVPEEYHEIYNKLKGVGCSTFMFPAYIPDGFQVTETKLHSNANDENVKFVMLYEDGTDYLIFQVSHGGDSSFPIYEKDSQSVEIYNQNDIDYYIFTNLASLVSVWSKDHTEYSVSTTLSLPALKEIIDSVFEEVIEQ